MAVVYFGYDCVAPDKQLLAKELDERLGQFSALAHASMAKVALAAADFDEIAGWGAPGIVSFAHWMNINLGFHPHTAAELVRVGKALQGLPKITEAFVAGRLSFDKVRQLTSVATLVDEEVLLEMARGASASQLARICASLRRLAEAEQDRYNEKQLEKRALWSQTTDDGMLRLVAILPAEEGAIVMAAIESIAKSQQSHEKADGAVRDPALESWPARCADALVAMSNHVLAGGAEELVKSSQVRQVVVHVDVGVLTGEDRQGQSCIEGGALLSREVARRIGCDCQVVGMTERDGLPIDVGRARYVIPTSLRRALEVRDGFCRFPGCGVPARRTEGHHVDHWVDGGRTDFDNIALLCGFHHARLHDGAFRIVKSAEGFRFETHDGCVIGQRNLSAPDLEPNFPLECSRAEWGGERLDLDHTLFVLTQHRPEPFYEAPAPDSG